MNPNDKFKDAYRQVRPAKVREIIESGDWEVDNVDYNKNLGKYIITATHVSGQVIVIERNKNYVDKIIEELTR